MRELIAMSYNNTLCSLAGCPNTPRQCEVRDHPLSAKQGLGNEYSERGSTIKITEILICKKKSFSISQLCLKMLEKLQELFPEMVEGMQWDLAEGSKLSYTEALQVVHDT